MKIMIRRPKPYQKNYAHYKVKLGNVYLYDNYVITEFDEGTDITFKSFSDVADILKIHFKNKPFGFIADRVNSYALDINDAHLYHKTFPHLKAYAVVAYKPMTHHIFEIENRFFKFNRKAFNTLEKAIDWVNNELDIRI